MQPNAGHEPLPEAGAQRTLEAVGSMRMILIGTALGLLLGLTTVQASDKDAPTDCGSYGTAVEFLETPAMAAKQAAKEQKLVFVLHVSGHFEDPGIT